MRKIRLKDCVEKITKGSTPKKFLNENYDKKNIPFVKAGDLKKKYISDEKINLYIDDKTNQQQKRSIIKPNDILLSIAGNIGQSSVVKSNSKTMNCNQAVAIIRPKNIINNRYLMYWLNSENSNDQIKMNTVKVAVPNLSLKSIGDLRIPICSLNKQNRIVDILDQAHSILEEKNNMANLANRLTESIFYNIFGNPDSNEKNWPKYRIEDLTVLVTSGSTPKGGDKNYLSEGPYFIRSQNVYDNQLILKNIKHISTEIHSKMNRSKVKYDDVLLNITGASIGRVCVFDLKNVKANVNQHVAIIRTNSKILSIYLSTFFCLPYGKSIIENSQSGATRQALNFQKIKEMLITLPPMQLQRKFQNLYIQNIDILNKIEKTKENIDNLFKVLLQKAFNGDLIIDRREGHMEDLLQEVEHQNKYLPN